MAVLNCSGKAPAGGSPGARGRHRIGDKIAAVGVSRNTYYEWMKESFRPNRIQAAKLAELTGYSADAIHGQEGNDADARRTIGKKAVDLEMSTCMRIRRN